jgi:outer membrane protein
MPIAPSFRVSISPSPLRFRGSFLLKTFKLKLLLGIACTAPGSLVSAETLQEALVQAYQSNPTLTGARAGQRATDETVTIARARTLPNANARAGYNENIETFPGSAPARRASLGVSVDIPLYSAGLYKNGVRAAEARVEAGQANLRGVESDVFVSVVTAYMDVLRDEAIVDLNRGQVKLLKVNLEATRDRFEVGDLTRTDVAQSEARLARATSDLRSAEAQLIGSRERYVQVVGSEPGTLAQPPQLPGMPTSVGQAVETALEDNPDLLAVNNQRRSAAFDVKSARAQRMPRVSGVVDTSYGNYLGSGPSIAPSSQHSVSAGVQATIPLFTGGAEGAQIRQSQARLNQTMEQIIEVERLVIARTRSTYASWQAAKDVIQSSDVAVKANALALEGVRAENSVGTRTILDILNAQQELLNSEVQLVVARRNAYVAGFQLLASMGHAEYADLNLDGGTLYDPNVNYKRVTKTIWDWKDDPMPVASGSRTVDTKPQTPALTMPKKK